jgi:hypothetical protein
MAYPAQMQQMQPMQPAMAAPSAALQQVLPRAAMKAPVPTPTQATAQLSQVVGNVQSERAEARRTSFQVFLCAL